MLTSLESQLKESLSLNTIYLHKALDETQYAEGVTSAAEGMTSSHSFTVPATTPQPGVVRVKQYWQMLYQIVRGIVPPVHPVDGDSLVLKLASRHEIRLKEALDAQKKKF